MSITKKYIIQVTFKSFKSFHGSFKKACEHYGWNYQGERNKPFPRKIGIYDITKEDYEVAIPALQLRKFLETSFDQTNNWNQDAHISSTPVDWDLDDGTYTVEAQVSVSLSKHVEDWEGVDRDFSETDTTIEEIVRVLDVEGNEVNLDHDTAVLLISKLEL